jgi:LPXTG-site transpeptidase (sortase) family protein
MEQNTHTATYEQAQHPSIDRGMFASVLIAAFLVLTGFLSYIDFLPEAPQAEAEMERSMPIVHDPREFGYEQASPLDETEKVLKDTTVRRIVINAIGLNAPVVHPASTELAVLDQALLDGIVHYPDSGTVADVSNLLFFGHSSSLPFVHNRNFKIFNRLHELVAGDVIRVETDTHEYMYRVDRVRMVKAEEAMVRFDTDTRKLTLVTCNTSFGDKSDRYMVEASFIGVEPLTQGRN